MLQVILKEKGLRKCLDPRRRLETVLNSNQTFNRNYVKLGHQKGGDLLFVLADKRYKYVSFPLLNLGLWMRIEAYSAQ